jgi:hypothetical protein
MNESAGDHVGRDNAVKRNAVGRLVACPPRFFFCVGLTT